MREGPQLGKYLSPSWRKRQPYGSAMGLQAAPLRSPFKVVADALFSRRLLVVFIMIRYLALDGQKTPLTVSRVMLIVTGSFTLFRMTKKTGRLGLKKSPHHVMRTSLITNDYSTTRRACR